MTRSGRAYGLIIGLAGVLLLSACTADGKPNFPGEPVAIVRETQIPGVAWNDANLYGDIPAPAGGRVFELIRTEQEGMRRFTFQVEDFDQKEAEAYLETLATLGVTELHCDLSQGNSDFPQLNYNGVTADGAYISVSHSYLRAAIEIAIPNQRSSAQNQER